MTNERSDDRLERLLQIIDAELLQASQAEIQEARGEAREAAGRLPETGAEAVRNLIRTALDEARLGNRALLPWMDKTKSSAGRSARK